MQFNPRQQGVIAALLGVLVLATHGHHFASALNLPPATWVVFFAAGFYLRRAAVFAALLAEVVVLDYLAVTMGGVSSFCLSPAYGFMLPAYGGLWLAGRWFAQRYSFHVKALPALGASFAGGFTLAEMFSSGGFYFFSGRFAETSMSEFATRLVQYFPYSLQSFAFWVSVLAIVHIAFVLARGKSGQHV